MSLEMLVLNIIDTQLLFYLGLPKSNKLVGFQNESPQDVSQCYADLIELQATLAAGSKETSAPYSHPIPFLTTFRRI